MDDDERMDDDVCGNDERVGDSVGGGTGGTGGTGGKAAAGGDGVSGPGVSSRERQRRSARVRRGLRHEVTVTVPLETIAGDADEPGYLARYGPIGAGLARRMAWEVAAQGWWRCAVTDDVHGTLLGLGRSTFVPGYEAPAALQRFLNLRDRTCDFPGCRQAALSCEFDHHVPFPQGATCECNGRKRCKHHHRLKHETPWAVTESPDPDDPPGTMIWTTPAGRSYRSTSPVIGIPTGPEPVHTCRDRGPDHRSAARQGARIGRTPEHDVWACNPAAKACDHPVHVTSEGADPNPPPF